MPVSVIAKRVCTTEQQKQAMQTALLDLLDPQYEEEHKWKVYGKHMKPVRNSLLMHCQQLRTELNELQVSRAALLEKLTKVEQHNAHLKTLVKRSTNAFSVSESVNNGMRMGGFF